MFNYQPINKYLIINQLTSTGTVNEFRVPWFYSALLIYNSLKFFVKKAFLSFSSGYYIGHKGAKMSQMH